MLDEYKALNVKPANVFPQSFHHADIMYWIQHETEFAKQAVFLDAAEKPEDLPDLEKLKQYKKQGIRIVAPPIFALLDVKDKQMVPSRYAKEAKDAGLDIITWSLERSASWPYRRAGGITNLSIQSLKMRVIFTKLWTCWLKMSASLDFSQIGQERPLITQTAFK